MTLKIVILTGAVGVGLFSGCQSIPPGAEPGPHGTIAYYVPAETSEPGARIRVNGEDVGQTPLTIKIWGDKDGTFHDFGSCEYVVQAFPIRTNQFVQTRVFGTGRMFTPEDRIPSQIYFDLNQPPVFYPVPAYSPPVYHHHYYPYPYYYYPAPYYYYRPSPPIHHHPPPVHVVPRPRPPRG